MVTNGFKVSVAISSVTIPAEKFVEILGESTVHRKGDAVSSSPGAPLRERSVWMMKSLLNNDRVPEDQILDILDSIESKIVAVAGLGEDVQIDIWCMVTNEAEQCGFSFAPKTMGRIAKLGASLVFDVYR